MLLPNLINGWSVDNAILSEDSKVVIIRFGKTTEPESMEVDALLYKVSGKIRNFATIYSVDIDEVPDFNAMYELYDPVSIMFFFRNKHIYVDLGTGNNNKINWVFKNAQEFIDIVEAVYRGATKGRGLVVSPRDYSSASKQKY
ncbi:MAG: Thioredoxin-like 4A [Marteilia pararefringens]